jgi:hypothetical protein
MSMIFTSLPRLGYPIEYPRVFEVLGGRFSDLQIFMSKIENDNMSPAQAVEEMIEATAGTVRALLAREIADSTTNKWTRSQLWRAIELLATHEATTTKDNKSDSKNNATPGGSGDESKNVNNSTGIAYDVFLWKVLRGDELVFRQMLVSQLITVDFEEVEGNRKKRLHHGVESVESASDSHSGVSEHTINASSPESLSDSRLRRRVVKAGSPLFQEVYQRLYEDIGLRAVYGREVMLEEIKKCEKRLDNYERDLVRLQEVDDVKREKWRDLEDPNKTLNERKKFLLDLMREEHDKLVKFHAKRREYQDLLKKRN